MPQKQEDSKILVWAPQIFKRSVTTKTQNSFSESFVHRVYVFTAEESLGLMNPHRQVPPKEIYALIFVMEEIRKGHVESIKY